MKFRIGSNFAEFGRPEDQRNVIKIREVGTDRRIIIGLFAESFDTGLSFYILLTEYMIQRAASTVTELQGRNVRRVSADLSSRLAIQPQLVSPKTVIYQDLPIASIGHVFNTAWLSCSIRVLGLRTASSPYKNVPIDFQHDILPHEVEFIIAKYSVGISDLLTVQCNSAHFSDLVSFLYQSSGQLKHELVQTRLLTSDRN